MTNSLRLAVKVVAASAATLLLASPAAALTGDDNWRAKTDRDAYLVGGTRAAPSNQDSGSSGRSNSASSAEFRRTPISLCSPGKELGTLPRLGVDCPASSALVITVDCEPDSVSVDPLFRRSPDPFTADGWGEWEMVDNGCLSVADIGAAVAQEFRRLPLTPSTLSVQPPSGWTLVNADTIAFADDDDTQTLLTTVLGLGVTIRATPDTFTWSFGDGSPELTTSDPGRPWPDHTVAHRYTSEGMHAISLTTTWAGTFQVAGSSTWAPVDGTATTTSTSPPLTVYEARSRLVSESAG
ncbi:PKD domain-containing protein [Cellulomonas aerilata]|uniref:PKD domain-containing protein n=1 Tax=Cellulomonas aerilata TaxID=515326 RepID=A0A512D8S9_9CELL|nr:PKD domain-containing protein [Cellulomonas aerilata]GEO32805.1 hypothetical protein CAE01nite_05300 [Cellulomonas aerilata]